MICPNCNDTIGQDMVEFAILDPYSPCRIYLGEVERKTDSPDFPMEKVGDMEIESVFICPKCGTIRANVREV